MAIPKAAVQAIVKQVADELGLRFEVRATGNEWTDGFFVINTLAEEAHFVRCADGTVGAGWGKSNFNNGPVGESQQELKNRVKAIVQDLL